jgi:hypothetical protein
LDAESKKRLIWVLDITPGAVYNLALASLVEITKTKTPAHPHTKSTEGDLASDSMHNPWNKHQILNRNPFLTPQLLITLHNS